MKNLTKFLHFDLPAFLNGKVLTVTSCRPWNDRETGAHKGTVVDVAITRDDTAYPPAKDGVAVTNLYEKFPARISKDLAIPIGATIEIINGIGTVYGDFRNQLSVQAEDVKILTTPTAKGGKAE